MVLAVRMAFVDLVVGPGDVVLDVGAHVGLTAFKLAERVGPGGKVCAFEPSPDVFAVLENVHGLCGGMLVIDTLISLTAESRVEWRGSAYSGRRCREHEDDDTDAVRRSRVLKSIDNTFSFRFTRESLLRALQGTGFTSLCKCHVPAEPGKAVDRITLVALKRSPVRLSTYPWVNDKSETEIERALLPPVP